MLNTFYNTNITNSHFLLLHLNLVPGRSKEVNITNSIVYYICKENVPFSVVESEGFKKMVKTMCPLYKVPGRDTIRRQINYLFEIMANRFREELVNVDQFSITCDVWTETMTMRSFLGITIHFFKDIQMQSSNFYLNKC